MSAESDGNEEPDWTPRPIVFPTFEIPTRLGATLAWGLVAAASLAVIAALVRAVFYRIGVPSGSGLLDKGVTVFQPSFGLADRISLFASGAANLTVALLVVVAIVVTAMAVRRGVEGESPLRRWSALLVAAAVIASIVVVANVARAIVILNNATGLITAPDSANKASSVLNLLPPTLCAAAALVYAVKRVRTSEDQTRQAGG